MSSYHYNDISSHQIKTLEISERIICNKFKYRDSSVRSKFYNCSGVPLGMPSKVTNKNGLKNRMQSSFGEE